ncbi:Capsule biosynthesis protein CapC [Planctomycetes bacterium CA13]|uniref:Capsule biosynthesis protein CapC n=1 Tax=Novipirellula herctigrandis TaxID=2527986 RepID=A0A5C5YMX4_9BACT|nr:Capsule biosynthesis protein CapC [Planctomycetes bacterium CA13]
MDTTLVAITLGLIVSLVVTEVLGLSVGGMIVPGYIAMSLHQPMAVVLTVLAAAITWGIIRWVSRYAIVFGRRRVVLTVITGFAVGMTFRLLANEFVLHIVETSSVAASSVAASSVAASSVAGQVASPMVMIGLIIPGLIALWFERQGVIETLSPMLSAAVLVRLSLILIGMESLA